MTDKIDALARSDYDDHYFGTLTFEGFLFAWKLGHSAALQDKQEPVGEMRLMWGDAPPYAYWFGERPAVGAKLYLAPPPVQGEAVAEGQQHGNDETKSYLRARVATLEGQVAQWKQGFERTCEVENHLNTEVANLKGQVAELQGKLATCEILINKAAAHVRPTCTELYEELRALKLTAPPAEKGVVEDAAAEVVIRAAMMKSFVLGQTYWQQADSESISQQNKSDATKAKFDAFVIETCALLANKGEK